MNKLASLALAGLLTLGIAGAILVPQAESYAADKGLKAATNSMKTFSGEAGLTTSGDLTVIIGKVIRAFLGLLGTVFVVLTIYAGFLWMTASGNEEQISKAKKMISSAVIGIIIVLLAYVVTDFVFKALATATKTS